MDTVSPLRDQALARLLARFEQMDLGSLEHRHRMALAVLDEATRQAEPPLSPVEAVIDLSDKYLAGYFASALPPGPVSSQPSTLGLLAWRVTGGSRRWGNLDFFSTPPDELKSAIAGIRARTGPDLAVSSMTSRPMDFGPLEDIAKETVHQFAWGPILRAAVIWAVLFFVALAVHDRFFAP